MLRSALLFLSRRQWLRNWLEQSHYAKKLTSRFVAGESLVDALRVVQTISGQGIASTLDFLGENVTSLHEAEHCRVAYELTIQQIGRKSLPATVSVKPSQFGLDLSAERCLENLKELLENAPDKSQRIEVDMEGSAYTDRTLRLVRLLHEQFPGRVRAVIQAYLRRSQTDILELSEVGIPIRLCKGAYRENSEAAFTRKAQVDENYLLLAKLLLSAGTDPAIATHDPKMIRAAKTEAQSSGLSPRKFEFQMLYGIRRDLQEELVREGFRLRLYVPFGGAWYPYFMRRLAERPANLVFLLRNLSRN